MSLITSIAVQLGRRFGPVHLTTYLIPTVIFSTLAFNKLPLGSTNHDRVFLNKIVYGGYEVLVKITVEKTANISVIAREASSSCLL